MKIALEEIVKTFPQESHKEPGKRYRRVRLSVFEAPVELLPVLQDGFTLVIDECKYRVQPDTLQVQPRIGARRKMVVANVRVAALVAFEHVGLIVDLVEPALFEAIERDQTAPADYAEFCKLENIEP